MGSGDTERRERRKTRRRAAIWRAAWTGNDGASAAGRVVDVSAGGVCIELDAPQSVPAINTVGEVKVAVSGQLNLSLTGQVVHANGRRFGVSLGETPSEDRDILRHYAEGRALPA